MGLYRNILVAIDGSPDATAALRHAAALARDQNALLTLLSVAPNVSSATATAGANPDDPIDFYARILREAVSTLPADTGVKTLLERGDPADAILATADREGSDLIVMGSHGHGRFVRALIGSVSERVLKTSAAPVLLMRSGPPLADS
jgi:nucleotide-binding universal stress UspA family protein